MSAPDYATMPKPPAGFSVPRNLEQWECVDAYELRRTVEHDDRGGPWTETEVHGVTLSLDQAILWENDKAHRHSYVKVQAIRPPVTGPGLIAVVAYVTAPVRVVSTTTILKG